MTSTSADLGKWPSPDCAVGSHHACVEQALNEDTDEVVPCTCSCHGPAMRLLYYSDGRLLIESRAPQGEWPTILRSLAESIDHPDTVARTWPY